jgi:hypothetical protein
VLRAGLELRFGEAYTCGSVRGALWVGESLQLWIGKA